MIYKICTRDDWAACQRSGRLSPSADDREDGFVHLSAAHQVRGTLRRHFAGRTGLVLLEVDPARLPPEALRWEVSRGGDRFPHLYTDVPHQAVVRAGPVEAPAQGEPVLPFALAGEDAVTGEGAGTGETEGTPR